MKAPDAAANTAGIKLKTFKWVAEFYYRSPTFNTTTQSSLFTVNVFSRKLRGYVTSFYLSNLPILREYYKAGLFFLWSRSNPLKVSHFGRFFPSFENMFSEWKRIKQQEFKKLVNIYWVVTFHILLNKHVDISNLPITR